MSQGQELWSHVKRLVIGVPWAFQNKAQGGGKDSQRHVDQPVSKSVGQELEKGRELGG